MSVRLVRGVFGTLVIVCAVASSSVAGVSIAPPKAVAAPQRNAPPYVRRVSRTALIAGTGIATAVSAPPGCSSAGTSSFVGETAFATNFASGSYAGVLAGYAGEACDLGDVVGGGQENVVGGGDRSRFATIVGGNTNAIDTAGLAFIGGGFENSIGKTKAYTDASESAIVGGDFNIIGSPSSFIGAGQENTLIAATFNNAGQSAFIGAGYANNASGNFTAIGAGQDNVVSADNSTIVAGQENTITSRWGFIGAGQTNKLSGQSATLVGGYENSAAGEYASVGGGSHNAAGGADATIAGGASNMATGTDSFAAGTGSRALNTGTFVWSDDASGAHALSSSASNQFLARASGGYYLYSAANLSTGVHLASGSGSWSSLSDRAVKTGIEDIDDARILAKVAALPISEWSYSAQGTGIRHLGPMAQDFRAAFGLGEDEKHISAVDEEGIALAAIKALQAKLDEKDRQLHALRRASEDRGRADDARFSGLEARLEALSAQVAAAKHQAGS